MHDRSNTFSDSLFTIPFKVLLARLSDAGLEIEVLLVTYRISILGHIMSGKSSGIRCRNPGPRLVIGPRVEKNFLTVADLGKPLQSIDIVDGIRVLN